MRLVGCNIPSRWRHDAPGIGSRQITDLLHLRGFAFDRRWPPEDGDRNLEPRLLLVDLLDRPVEGREGPVGDTHLFADLEGDRGLRFLDTLFDLVDQTLRLTIRDRLRLVARA